MGAVQSKSRNYLCKLVVKRTYVMYNEAKFFFFLMLE